MHAVIEATAYCFHGGTTHDRWKARGIVLLTAMLAIALLLFGRIVDFVDTEELEHVLS